MSHHRGSRVKLPIYISSVLLERNRLSSEKTPSYRVSEWSQRFADAEFDGIELWENHLLLADSVERESVLGGPLPVTVLNTYCTFDDAGAKGRNASASLARFLNVTAVKFNFGNELSKAQTYIDTLAEWRDELPEDCRLLCECHPDTVLEEPDRAADILNSARINIEIIVHAFSGDDESPLRRWLDTFGPAVTHVHAVLHDRSRVSRRVEMLKQANFTGTCSIEFCAGVNQPPEDMNKLLNTAADDLRYLREVLA